MTGKRTDVWTCSRCNGDIVAKDVKLKECNVTMLDGAKLSMSYFVCPLCNVAYRTGLYSPTTRALRAGLLSAEKDWLHARQLGARNSIINRFGRAYTQARAAYKSEFDTLNTKYKGQTYQQIEGESLDMYVPGHSPDKEANHENV